MGSDLMNTIVLKRANSIVFFKIKKVKQSAKLFHSKGKEHDASSKV